MGPRFGVKYQLRRRTLIIPQEERTNIHIHLLRYLREYLISMNSVKQIRQGSELIRECELYIRYKMPVHYYNSLMTLMYRNIFYSFSKIRGKGNFLAALCFYNYLYLYKKNKLSSFEIVNKIAGHHSWKVILYNGFLNSGKKKYFISPLLWNEDIVKIVARSAANPFTNKTDLYRHLPSKFTKPYKIRKLIIGKNYKLPKGKNEVVISLTEVPWVRCDRRKIKTVNNKIDILVRKGSVLTFPVFYKGIYKTIKVNNNKFLLALLEKRNIKLSKHREYIKQYSLSNLDYDISKNILNKKILLRFLKIDSIQEYRKALKYYFNIDKENNLYLKENKKVSKYSKLLIHNKYKKLLKSTKKEPTRDLNHWEVFDCLDFSSITCRL